MKKINKYLLKQLYNYDERYEGVVCGSYRRKKDFSNDIDFLIVDTKTEDQKNILSKKKQLRNFVEYLREKKVYIG